MERFGLSWGHQTQILLDVDFSCDRSLGLENMFWIVTPKNWGKSHPFWTAYFWGLQLWIFRDGGCGERKHPAGKRVTKESVFLGGRWGWQRHEDCSNRNKNTVATTRSTSSSSSTTTRCFKSAIVKKCFFSLYISYSKRWDLHAPWILDCQKFRLLFQFQEMARGRSDRRNRRTKPKRRRNPISDPLDAWISISLGHAGVGSCRLLLRFP